MDADFRWVHRRTSLANEGLLPAVVLPGAGTTVSSGGDPVVVAGQGCSLYAATLSVDPVDPMHNPGGICENPLANEQVSFPGGSRARITAIGPMHHGNSLVPATPW